MKIRQTLNCARATCLRSIGTCLLIAFGVSLARAAEGTWTGSTEVSAVTSYLWRGFKLADTSLQPSITGIYSDKLMIGYWGSYAIEKDNDGRKYDETDILGSYTFSQNLYNLTLGGTYYRPDFLVDPSTGDDIDDYFEVFAQVVFKAKLNPSFTIWRELGDLHGHYFEFSLSHSIEVNQQNRVSIRPYVGILERDEHYYGADISLNRELGNNLYGRATLTGIKSSFGGDRVSFGVTIGKRF